MATGAAIASTATAALGVVQTIEAKNAMQNFEYQKLNNFYAGYTPSTKPLQSQQEQINRGLATSADAIQSSGARGLAYLPQAVGQANQASEQATNAYGEKVDQAKLMEIQESARLQNIQEQRDQAELAGMGQMYQGGLNTAVSGIASGLQSFAAMPQGASTAQPSLGNTSNIANISAGGVTPVGQQGVYAPAPNLYAPQPYGN